ncbi:MAG: hypothetical protein GC154_00460 [bacterium]|nr:hypothetical protein [bacterium]
MNLDAGIEMVLLTTGLFSTLILSGLFAAGYYWAWTDFKPRPIRPDEDIWIAPLADYSLQPLRRRRAYSDRELGLTSLDQAIESPHVQRSQKMRTMILNYAAENPEGTASVLKSWMSQP